MQESHEQLLRFKSKRGTTYEAMCACGPLYITINSNPVDEIFIRLGKAGGCASALNESVGKLISHYLQIGGDIDVVLKALCGVSCHSSSKEVPSCVGATADVIKMHKEISECDK